MRQILNELRHIIESKLNSANSTLRNVLSSYLNGEIHCVSRKAICRSREFLYRQSNMKERLPELYLAWPGCNRLTPSCSLATVHSLGTFITPRCVESAVIGKSTETRTNNESARCLNCTSRSRSTHVDWHYAWLSVQVVDGAVPRPFGLKTAFTRWQ